MLLNSVAGKEYKCKRGVRQRDPLSPLLFALAIDLLQCVLNKANENGTLSPTFPQKNEMLFPMPGISGTVGGVGGRDANHIRYAAWWLMPSDSLP